MKNTLLSVALATLLLISSDTLLSSPVKDLLRDVEITQTDSGVDGIDCVYVINLEFRPEKWNNTRDLLESYGIHPNRMDAIYGATLGEDALHALIGTYPKKLRPGEIGCILSHLSVLKDAYTREYRVIWVCEDDIAIQEDPHTISEILTQLDKIDPSWDILYTDPNSKSANGKVLLSVDPDFRPDEPHREREYYCLRKRMNRNILRLRQRFGAYSMIVSKRGIAKVLEYFTSRFLWSQYDVDIHYVPGIREYCIDHDLVTVNIAIPSDLEPDR